MYFVVYPILCILYLLELHEFRKPKQTNQKKLFDPIFFDLFVTIGLIMLQLFSIGSISENAIFQSWVSCLLLLVVHIICRIFLIFWTTGDSYVDGLKIRSIYRFFFLNLYIWYFSEKMSPVQRYAFFRMLDELILGVEDFLLPIGVVLLSVSFLSCIGGFITDKYLSQKNTNCHIVNHEKTQIKSFEVDLSDQLDTEKLIQLLTKLRTETDVKIVEVYRLTDNIVRIDFVKNICAKIN